MLSSSPSVSISIPASKARSITHLAYPVSFRKSQGAAFLPLQRRHYADEPATQSEPEADGATEAQHGDNSIAASADADADANTFTPAEQAEERAAASEVNSATEEATEQASSTAGSVKSAAQTAGKAVTGAAQSLGAAAGFGSQGSEAGSDAPPAETSKTVYVGNIFFDVRSEDLKKEFERAGPVVDVKIIMDPRGLSKGFVTVFPAFFQMSLHINPLALKWQLLILCLVDIDSATSTSKPSKPPSAPSNSSTCKTMKAAVSPSNFRSPAHLSLPHARLTQTRRIAQCTLPPRLSS